MPIFVLPAVLRPLSIFSYEMTAIFEFEMRMLTKHLQFFPRPRMFFGRVACSLCEYIISIDRCVLCSSIRLLNTAAKFNEAKIGKSRWNCDWYSSSAHLDDKKGFGNDFFFCFWCVDKKRIIDVIMTVGETKTKNTSTKKVNSYTVTMWSPMCKSLHIDLKHIISFEIMRYVRFLLKCFFEWNTNLQKKKKK